MARLRLTLPLVVAAGVLGAVTTAAAAPTTPFLQPLPSTVAQTSLGLAWTPSTFTPGSVSREYWVRVDDLTAATWVLLVVPEPATPAPAITATAAVTDGHAYGVRVRAVETVCKNAPNKCATLASPDSTQALTQVSLAPPSLGPGPPAAPIAPPPTPLPAPVPDSPVQLSATPAPQSPSVSAAGVTVSLPGSRPERPLLSRWVAPAPGRSVNLRLATRFRWRVDGKATFYNVQVYAGRRKVLSAWPTVPSFILPARAARAGPLSVVVWSARGTKSAPRYEPRPWLVQMVSAR